MRLLCSLTDAYSLGFDAMMGEVAVSCEKIRYTIREGEKAIRPERRSVPIFFQLGGKYAQTEYFPMGVVACIVPWVRCCPEMPVRLNQLELSFPQLHFSRCEHNIRGQCLHCEGIGGRHVRPSILPGACSIHAASSRPQPRPRATHSRVNFFIRFHPIFVILIASVRLVLL